MDFRRSGAVEALAGDVDLAALAAKMANSIDQSKDLQRTYLPVVSDFDARRLLSASSSTTLTFDRIANRLSDT